MTTRPWFRRRFTGQLWIIYLTGLLKIAGAVGLLMRPTRRLAGICLLLLLLALFPANVYAAMQGVQFRGAPPTDIWLRGLIQGVFLLSVWWSAMAWAGRLRRAPYPPMEPITEKRGGSAADRWAAARTSR